MNMDTIPEQLIALHNTTSLLASWLNTTHADTPNGKLISDYVFVIIQYIIYTVLCITIDICGTVGNILNIICFVKQGFKDPVNVSLLGLAISDICSLVPLIWTNICLTPAVSNADLPFEPVGFQSLTGAWPHLTFTRVIAWMTALITLERCLCVTAPLKVKEMFTPRRVSVITAIVFIILIPSIAPIYVVNRLEMTFFPTKNKTIIGLVFTENRETIEKVSFTINNVFVSFSAFIVIIVCTTILVVKLRNNTKWRNVTTTVTQADTVSSRNLKVSKMVVMISMLFVSCFVPVVFIIVAMITEPELSVTGKYINIGILLGGLGFVLESINSSMNIFIYYHMSSKYRDTFRKLFCYNGNVYMTNKQLR